MTTPAALQVPPIIIDPKELTVSVASAHVLTGTPVRSNHRRTMGVRFAGTMARLRDRLRSIFQPVEKGADEESEGDWAMGGFEELGRLNEPKALGPAPQRHPAPGPEQPLGASGSHTVQLPPQSAPQQQQPEPQLAFAPASPQDVLLLAGRDVMEMLGRDVSNRQAFDRLQRHMAELQKRYRQQENFERRSPANVAETQMNLALLEAADRRGEDDAAMADRAARMQADMLANAKRASDPLATGVMPIITDDMLDPRTVALPVESALGDAEPAESPVHAENTATIPAVPTQRVSDETPLPHRPFVGGVEPVVPDRAWSGDAEETHVSAAITDDADDARESVSK